MFQKGQVFRVGGLFVPVVLLPSLISHALSRFHGGCSVLSSAESGVGSVFYRLHIADCPLAIGITSMADRRSIIRL